MSTFGRDHGSGDVSALAPALGPALMLGVSLVGQTEWTDADARLAELLEGMRGDRETTLADR